MAKQTINIGTTPNDGTGDALRNAFDKTNSNFTELYDGKQDDLVSGTNIKTVNGNSLLGSGDLVVGGSSGITVGTTSVTSGTVGRVFFEGSGNVVQQDSSLFWDNTNKRLGVGATPATTVRLDVRAQGALSTDIAFRVRNSADTANLFQVNGNGNIWARGGGNQETNTCFGENSLTVNTSGTQNSSFGFNALRINTTGFSNNAYGRFSLYSNTSGHTNNSFGTNALYLNNTGFSNNAFGKDSLYSNTSGTANCAFGNNSLLNNTTGGSNCAFGTEAGQRIAAGTENNICNNSVFIGFNTRPLSNNQTNQIVIGDAAIGNGSNTVTLGNTSIIKTILRGTINAANLPTSSAGLSAGDIWNNGGVLNIV
jgi:hypothetical protein